MAANLHVVDMASFISRPSPAPAQQPTHPGYKLLDENLCLACHSIDGQPGIGPTLKGVYGREEKLSDGSVATVDDAFVRQKIVEPNAKIVAGTFEQEMPKTDLTPEQIDQIIDYLKTLK
jgi:cytochrome c oxidase subunit 2